MRGMLAPALPVLVSLCRGYQRLFPGGHPGEGALVGLHREGARSGDWTAFLQEYFEHEYEKGKAALARFDAITTEWHGGRVLDFGAGAGGLTCRIAESASEAVGLDVEAEKLAYAGSQAAARRISRARFACYDGALPSPFPDGAFDAIVCVDVLEHLPTPARFLGEFRRLLRPGGLLLLSFGPPWGHAHGKHMWTQLPGWWTHLLFPRPAVMRVLGKPETTTYEDLGLFRLSIGTFERLMRRAGFERVYERQASHRLVSWLARVPLLRGLFISEVVGVYRAPAAGAARGGGAS